jgi:hypothetical protein
VVAAVVVQIVHKTFIPQLALTVLVGVEVLPEIILPMQLLDQLDPILEVVAVMA